MHKLLFELILIKFSGHKKLDSRWCNSHKWLGGKEAKLAVCLWEKGKSYSFCPVNHSDISHLLVSVSSHIRKRAQCVLQCPVKQHEQRFEKKCLFGITHHGEIICKSLPCLVGNCHMIGWSWLICGNWQAIPKREQYSIDPVF